MRTSVSLWDALFGKKATMDVSTQDGRTKKIRVTVRWLAEMQRQGKVKPAGGQIIKAHILDTGWDVANLLGISVSDARNIGLPTGDGPYRVEDWVIGKDITPEQYDKLKHPTTGEIFAVIMITDGKRQPSFLPREKWLEFKHRMGAIDNSY